MRSGNRGVGSACLQAAGNGGGGGRHERGHSLHRQQDQPYLQGGDPLRGHPLHHRHRELYRSPRQRYSRVGLPAGHPLGTAPGSRVAAPSLPPCPLRRLPGGLSLLSLRAPASRLGRSLPPRAPCFHRRGPRPPSGNYRTESGAGGAALRSQNGQENTAMRVFQLRNSVILSSHHKTKPE